jgi:hypothetical protein
VRGRTGAVQDAGEGDREFDFDGDQLALSHEAAIGLCVLAVPRSRSLPFCS